MPKYLIHLVETRFYDVVVDGSDPDIAVDNAIMEIDKNGSKWLDEKSTALELASWPESAIERLASFD